MRISVAFCTPIPEVMGPAGPRLAMITPQFMRARMSMGMPTNFHMTEIAADGMEVGEARNFAVEQALASDLVPDFIFFLDYDVLPSQDAFQKLYYRAKCYPDYEIVSGLYCCKAWTGEPLIYKDWGDGAHWDWAMGDLLFDMVGVHSGLTLIRTSLFKRLSHTAEKPWYKTLDELQKTPAGYIRHRGTEDLWFCHRAVEEAGAKILVDTSVLAGHIDHATGIICGLPPDCPPVKRADWLREQNEPKRTKKALDIGAGDHKRTWPGYKTTSIDVRPQTKPDFVMDARLLNFPDDHFDMVASCHTFEHIPRWEQETVWKESVRVLKPGGKVEHIIPNLEWAAQHIANDTLEESGEVVYNVLYGEQEIGNCERANNTHYFGYTPRVAKELAEAAGLVNVEVKSYKDDPKCQWELWLTGEKPKPNKKKAKRNGK